MKWVDKIYIISLPHHKMRKKYIFNDLNSAGFDTSKIEWIDAVNGNDLDIDECIKDGRISNTFIDPAGMLTKSIYGCALSHQNAYQKFLKTSDDIKTALILEDDAMISNTLLRILLPNSDANSILMNEMANVNWDVIMVGGQLKYMDCEPPDGTRILRKMKKDPNTYAAHSYIINKSSAEKLIESNKSIQFAADVNIHCGIKNLYSTHISYFFQRMGDIEKWRLGDFQQKFVTNVLYQSDGWDIDEVASSTTYGDYGIESSEERDTLTSQISKKISVESVNWKPFTAPNGDVLHNWANIKLKTNE